MKLDKYIKNCYIFLPLLTSYEFPWKITSSSDNIIEQIILNLSSKEYKITWNIAVHKTAIIEQWAIIKEYSIIWKNCSLASWSYLRNWVYLGENVIIWPGVEIKSSFIFNKSRIAHFNFIGDSIIGENVNFEAWSIIANHFNEDNRDIELLFENWIINSNTKKFGAIVGDNSKIWANSVLAPWSVLLPWKIVERLEYYKQL